MGMKQAKTTPIVISAGGTGGHLFPAQALVQELRRRNRQAVVITDRRGMRWQDQFEEAPMFETLSGTTEQSGALARVKAVTSLAIGTLQALTLMWKYNPRVVIGFGGYPSLPGMFAGIVAGKRTCFHEQNRVVGRANRLIAPRMTAIALTFPEPKGLHGSLKIRAKVTGNPVRDAVIAKRDMPYPLLDEKGPVELLVFGGSQGASIFSQVVPSAIARLPSDLKSRLRVVQQCRAEDLVMVRAVYDQVGITAELATFFSDLPERMARAHLVISRSGASTVCELMVIGRPAVLVPLKGALDGDQAANAAFLQDEGGGWMMPESEFTSENLNGLMVQLLRSPERLQRAAEVARALGRPDAVVSLADMVEAIEGAR